MSIDGTLQTNIDPFTATIFLENIDDLKYKCFVIRIFYAGRAVYVKTNGRSDNSAYSVKVFMGLVFLYGAVVKWQHTGLQNLNRWFESNLRLQT